MDGDEIREWAESYDEGYDDALHEIEQSLHSDLQDQGYITQDQLKEVVTWKLDNQVGRQARNIERVERVSEEFIEWVSKAALSESDPVLQLKTLSSIPGIGVATATVVLTFYDPETYAVGDRYMVHALLNADRQMRVKDYPELLKKLRQENPGDFELRTVEKAFYQRYRVEHDIA